MYSPLRLLSLLAIVAPLILQGQTSAAQEADEIISPHFQVTVDGEPAQVLHAAVNLYFLNIVAGKHRHITVTAPSDDFWAKGVEVQPWRLNIRPQIHGRRLDFDLDGEAKLTLSRPNDFFAASEMLYLFANAPETAPPTTGSPTLRYYGPGIHHENIDAHSGDTIYLAPGAIVFGSLNLWGVEHVKVFGRGVLVYDGPQNPADDDGWQHKPNWHCIVMDHAQEVSIEGITCVVRSRTWQIQMTESRHIVFDNIKVIGANSGNANADGMDWLGGGDTVVRNSFFRAADDVLALQTGWNGYSDAALADQGHPVTNILIENTVVSTSISNIVRAAWPRKNFEGGNFEMRDSDVLHSGLGGCGIPFALMEMWADPEGRGESAGFHFDNIRMEDWNTLFQLRQIAPGIRDVTFTDVMAPEQPALVASTVKGDIAQVRLDNVIAAGTLVAQPSDLPIETLSGAAQPTLTSTAPGVRLRPITGLVRPGRKVHFEAVPEASSSNGRASGLRYTWLFGDGSKADGRKVKHSFPDTDGTLHDGTGRFRVLLHVSTSDGRNVWLYQPVLVTQTLHPAVASAPGIAYTYREESSGAPDSPAVTGAAAAFSLDAVPHRPEHYTLTLEGDLNAPVDGAYTLLAVANENATLTLDGQLVSKSPPALAQVCGLAGDAARPIYLYAALAKGPHRLKVTEAHTTGADNFRMLWQGPGFAMQPVSPAIGAERALPQTAQREN